MIIYAYYDNMLYYYVQIFCSRATPKMLEFAELQSPSRVV